MDLEEKLFADLKSHLKKKQQPTTETSTTTPTTQDQTVDRREKNTSNTHATAPSSAPSKSLEPQPPSSRGGSSRTTSNRSSNKVVAFHQVATEDSHRPLPNSTGIARRTIHSRNLSSSNNMSQQLPATDNGGEEPTTLTKKEIKRIEQLCKLHEQEERSKAEMAEQMRLREQSILAESSSSNTTGGPGGGIPALPRTLGKTIVNIAPPPSASSDANRRNTATTTTLDGLLESTSPQTSMDQLNTTTGEEPTTVGTKEAALRVRKEIQAEASRRQQQQQHPSNMFTSTTAGGGGQPEQQKQQKSRGSDEWANLSLDQIPDHVFQPHSSNSTPSSRGYQSSQATPSTRGQSSSTTPQAAGGEHRSTRMINLEAKLDALVEISTPVNKKNSSSSTKSASSSGNNSTKRSLPSPSTSMGGGAPNNNTTMMAFSMSGSSSAAAGSSGRGPTLSPSHSLSRSGGGAVTVGTGGENDPLGGSGQVNSSNNNNNKFGKVSDTRTFGGGSAPASGMNSISSMNSSLGDKSGIMLQSSMSRSGGGAPSVPLGPIRGSTGAPASAEVPTMPYEELSQFNAGLGASTSTVSPSGGKFPPAPIFSPGKGPSAPSPAGGLHHEPSLLNLLACPENMLESSAFEPVGPEHSSAPSGAGVTTGSDQKKPPSSARPISPLKQSASTDSFLQKSATKSLTKEDITKELDFLVEVHGAPTSSMKSSSASSSRRGKN